MSTSEEQLKKKLKKSQMVWSSLNPCKSWSGLGVLYLVGLNFRFFFQSWSLRAFPCRVFNPCWFWFCSSDRWFCGSFSSPEWWGPIKIWSWSLWLLVYDGLFLCSLSCLGLSHGLSPSSVSTSVLLKVSVVLPPHLRQSWHKTLFFSLHPKPKSTEKICF